MRSKTDGSAAGYISQCPGTVMEVKVLFSIDPYHTKLRPSAYGSHLLCKHWSHRLTMAATLIWSELDVYVFRVL